jgi:hypothetical protein
MNYKTLGATLLLLTASVNATGECKYGVLERRDWRSLSRDERVTYIQAFRKLYEPDDSNNLSFMDRVAKLHLKSNRMIHGTARFLPWHRYFLQVTEKQLQEVSGKPLAIPYWSTGHDSQAPELSQVFGTGVHTFGGNGNYQKDYCVDTGPFADVKLAFVELPHDTPGLVEERRCLRRQWYRQAKIETFTPPRLQIDTSKSPTTLESLLPRLRRISMRFHMRTLEWTLDRCLVLTSLCSGCITVILIVYGIFGSIQRRNVSQAMKVRKFFCKTWEAVRVPISQGKPTLLTFCILGTFR